MSIGIVYARESFRTDDLPIARQVDIGTQTVLSHHLTPEVHVEPPGNRSGRSDKKRPEWRIVKRRLQDAEVKMLWVADLSRAYRSVVETLKLVADLNARHIKFISQREQFDTSTAAGRLFLTYLAGLNQYGSEEISERATIHNTYLRDKGVLLGPPPIGLKRQGRGQERTFVPDEDKSYRRNGHLVTTLDTVQAWLTLLTGPQEIGVYRGAVLLNSEGYRVIGRDGAPHPVREHDLRHINRAVWDPKRPEVRSAYAGILEDTLIARAQGVLRARSGRRANGRATVQPPLLLKGLVVCETCGAIFRTGHPTYVTRSQEKKSVAVYRHYAGACPDELQVMAHILDRQVLKILAQFKSVPPSVLKEQVEQMTHAREDPYQSRRDFLEAKLMRLEKYLVDGLISEETYRKERPVAQRELADLPPLPPPPTVATTEDYLKLLQQASTSIDLVESLDGHVAHQMMKQLVSRVIVQRKVVREVQYQPELQVIFERLIREGYCTR